MKKILLLVLLTISFASAEEIVHEVSRGRHHKGGEVRIETVDSSADQFVAKLKYKIIKKFYIPISNSKLQGELSQELPTSFATLEGYESLERDGELDLEKATIKFVKRTDVGQYYDSFEFQILPKNGKWKATIWYHPDVESLGWHRSEITIYAIPVLGQYNVSSSLKN
ncbi:hypothetical protein [Halobacteriovorax sp. HLS]|uniref:hypothetical protein n=1 Tax=Halobacteriovorax sp. HLS TaxID=2234000 RepID=UPI000FD7DC95|nr:hypothetical protein [Halobacteriovorax sp. HLS]